MNARRANGYGADMYRALYGDQAHKELISRTKEQQQLQIENVKLNAVINYVNEDHKQYEAELREKRVRLNDALATAIIEKEQYEQQKLKLARVLEREEARVKEVLAEKEDDCCVICMDSPRQVAIIPCGHLCLCEACSVAEAPCPICRRERTGTLKTFRA
jgi:hypothetical protein